MAGQTHSLKVELKVDVPAQLMHYEKSELEAWFDAHFTQVGINLPALAGSLL